LLVSFGLILAALALSAAAPTAVMAAAVRRRKTPLILNVPNRERSGACATTTSSR
jgi:hypothetical protein